MVRYLISSTGVIHGRGSTPWKWVAGLTARERVAVRMGKVVFIRDPAAWHHWQSGYKVVHYQNGRYFHREPSAAQLAMLPAGLLRAPARGKGGK